MRYWLAGWLGDDLPKDLVQESEKDDGANDIHDCPCLGALSRDGGRQSVRGVQERGLEAVKRVVLKTSEPQEGESIWPSSYLDGKARHTSTHGVAQQGILPYGVIVDVVGYLRTKRMRV